MPGTAKSIYRTLGAPWLLAIGTLQVRSQSIFGKPMTITKVDFSRLRILVIDDSQFVRRLVQEVLLSFGVGKVIAVDSADQAFKAMAINRPDLIICDWLMYPIDGLTILRRLRNELEHRYPGMPFIMLTGHSGNDEVATALGEGADSYIVKPFSARTLMQHLLKVIAAHKPQAREAEEWAV